MCSSNLEKYLKAQSLKGYSKYKIYKQQEEKLRLKFTPIFNRTLNSKIINDSDNNENTKELDEKDYKEIGLNINEYKQRYQEALEIKSILHKILHPNDNNVNIISINTTTNNNNIDQNSTENNQADDVENKMKQNDEFLVTKCLNNLPYLPPNVVTVFPTKIQMDAIKVDLLEAINSILIDQIHMKNHILKCFDILNYPAIPLVKGYEETLNQNWEGSGKTSFLKQLYLRLEKSMSSFT
ncbi:unnamed protein product [Cunninghamella blakesleeana]